MIMPMLSRTLNLIKISIILDKWEHFLLIYLKVYNEFHLICLTLHIQTGMNHTTLQEKSKLETDNSVSNPSGNGIPDGLETEFSVFKTLVSNCVRLNSVSN